MPHGAPRLRTSDNKQNIAGPHVRERRRHLQLTQDALCGRLALATNGEWNPTPGDIYRIEAQRRIVADLELVALAEALECDLYALVAPAPGKPIRHGGAPAAPA
jgi:hypothetical protein